MSDTITFELLDLEASLLDVVKCEEDSCDNEATWRGVMTCPCRFSLLVCDECQPAIDRYVADGDTYCLVCNQEPVFVTWADI